MLVLLILRNRIINLCWTLPTMLTTWQDKFNLVIQQYEFNTINKVWNLLLWKFDTKSNVGCYCASSFICTFLYTYNIYRWNTTNSIDLDEISGREQFLYGWRVKFDCWKCIMWWSIMLEIIVYIIVINLTLWYWTSFDKLMKFNTMIWIHSFKLPNHK